MVLIWRWRRVWQGSVQSRRVKQSWKSKSWGGRWWSASKKSKVLCQWGHKEEGLRSELKDDQTHPEAKWKHLWVHKKNSVWCASKVYLSFCLLSSVNITTISMPLITHGCFHEKTTQLHENYFLLHTFPTYIFSVRTQQLFQTKKTHKCYSPQSLQIS